MTSPPDTSFTSGVVGDLRWRLTELALGRSFRRVARTIELRVRANELDGRWALYLKAICLLEMSQRPLGVRVVERCVNFITKLVRPARSMTLGPLQLADAPLSFGQTVDQALVFLQVRGYVPMDREESIRALAGHWYGSTQIDSGASINYSDALLVSISVLASDLVDAGLSNAKMIVGLMNDSVLGVKSSGMIDDLPWRASGCTGILGEGYSDRASPLGMYKWECTDFSLWRLNSSVGVVMAPWKFHNSILLLGDARMWISAWRRHGWLVGRAPVKGCVAYFAPNVGGAGELGHVAVVASVDDNSVTIEEYNFGSAPNDHRYGTRTIPQSLPSAYLYHPDSLHVPL